MWQTRDLFRKDTAQFHLKHRCLIQMFALFSLLLISAAHAAPSCQQNVLVDDFVIAQQDFIDGLDRYVSLLGGDYGGQGVEMDFGTVGPTNGHVLVVPTEKSNHFFFKLNKEACVDISSFSALRVVLSAPAGANAKFTLTQKTKDCKERVEGGDSTYVSLSKYVQMDGNVQTLIMPLSDFAGRADASKVPAPFDFLHLKDFTFVDMMPMGSEWRIYEIEMIGTCDGAAAVGSLTTGNVTATTTVAPTTTLPAGTVAAPTPTATGLAAAPSKTNEAGQTAAKLMLTLVFLSAALILIN